MGEMAQNVENPENTEKLEKKKPKITLKIGKKGKLPKRENKSLPQEANLNDQYQLAALKMLEIMHQAVGEKTEKNNPKKTKSGKKRKTSKQEIEAQPRDSSEDELDGKKIETFMNEIAVQPLELLKDERSSVVERLNFFVDVFIKEFGGKLDQYTGYMLEQQGTPMKNGIIPTTPRQLPNADPIINIIPQAMSVVSMVENMAFKKRTQKATKIINLLEKYCTYKGVDLQRALINLGCIIFKNFECQYMALDEGQLQERIALATDAVERIMNGLCLPEYIYPKSHELTPEGFWKFLYRCFLEGKSKGFIGNYFPRRKIMQNSQKIKISSIYKKVGLAILDEQFRVTKYFKKKDNVSNTIKYGYRLCSVIEFENEQEMETKIRELYEEEPKPENAYEYLLRPDDINETVQQFLKANLLREIHLIKKLKTVPKLKSKM